MDPGDLRNSVVEELPISDMRASAYTLASASWDLCVCMRDKIIRRFKKTVLLRNKHSETALWSVYFKASIFQTI